MTPEGKPPTGKELELPPQLFHLDFTEAGLVREIGFYVVDRRQGNTGGLGGAFGSAGARGRRAKLTAAPRSFQ